jgi:protein-L-isoaspartate O-methyltransferase
MNRTSMPDVTAYLTGAATIGASLTLTDIGAIVGIAIAVLGFFVNTIVTYRRDRREQRESDAKLARIKKRW